MFKVEADELIHMFLSNCADGGVVPQDQHVVAFSVPRPRGRKLAAVIVLIDQDAGTVHGCAVAPVTQATGRETELMQSFFSIAETVASRTAVA